MKSLNYIKIPGLFLNLTHKIVYRVCVLQNLFAGKVCRNLIKYLFLCHRITRVKELCAVCVYRIRSDLAHNKITVGAVFLRRKLLHTVSYLMPRKARV